MVFMKIKECSLAMHDVKFQRECFSTEFQSIIEVSKLSKLRNIYHSHNTLCPTDFKQLQTSDIVISEEANKQSTFHSLSI